jgi:Asp-tRNA(Asn)/Glu-tRNA(Gln) amidotransferase A subunit family amidase
MSFRFRTAEDLGRAYREGRSTPVEVAERAIEAADRFDGLDPSLRTFIDLRPDDVRAQARASAERFREGAPLGPLDGVPVAIKDEFNVKGYPTTSGTAFLGGKPVSRDALVVERLRRAGAILFGKTNMHELGLGPSGVNIFHGAARNPFDPARDTGGSSSGSAAAVASGVVPLALGNDGGGSIRIPAALCGVPAIKGTYGRVPTEGVEMTCWSLEHSGPMGSSVADVALAFRALTGEPVPLEAPRGRSGKLRLGVCDAWWAAADVSVTRLAKAALDRLVEAGAELVSVELRHIHLAQPVGFATFGVETAAAVMPHLLANRPMSPAVRAALDLARGISATTFVQAQRARALIARDFDAALGLVDALVTPTTGISARVYEEDTLLTGELNDAAARLRTAFTFPLNLTGLPAAQVPCGFDGEGMPVGLQVIAGRGEDELALAVAAEVEKTAERRQPKVWVDLLG